MLAQEANLLENRFRNYFPVVIDIETAGFNARTDAMLEIAATTLRMDFEGVLHPATTVHFHIAPFEGANIEKSAIEFNGIDPFSPLRGAINEKDALQEIFKVVRKEMKEAHCTRALMVAHNASFDMSFFNAAIERNNIKRSPFHPFASFDTATLAGLALGHTVLAKACLISGLGFDNNLAHSARYDTEKTADLFCHIVNRWKSLGGWPLPDAGSSESD